VSGDGCGGRRTRRSRPARCRRETPQWLSAVRQSATVRHGRRAHAFLRGRSSAPDRAARGRAGGFSPSERGFRGGSRRPRDPVGADLAGTETAPERAVGDKPMPSSRTVGSTSWPTSTPTTRAVVALDVAHRHAARRPLPSREQQRICGGADGPGAASDRRRERPRERVADDEHGGGLRGQPRRYEWACPGDLLHIDSKRFARFTRTVTPSPVISTAAAARSGCGSAPELARSVVDDHPRLPTASSTATRRPRTPAAAVAAPRESRRACPLASTSCATRVDRRPFNSRSRNALLDRRAFGVVEDHEWPAPSASELTRSALDRRCARGRRRCPPKGAEERKEMSHLRAGSSDHHAPASGGGTCTRSLRATTMYCAPLDAMWT
jgi:hypothetical protein